MTRWYLWFFGVMTLSVGILLWIRIMVLHDYVVVSTADDLVALPAWILPLISLD